MKIVGLTGGIGSGKTTVAKQFKALGVPVYIADEEAKTLIKNSQTIKSELINLFGEQAYLKGELNRAYIADIIFNDKSYLEQMNAIIHPKVKNHFNEWLKSQKGVYVIKEVAILFENGGDQSCDYVVTVIAPKSKRIERVLKRDNTTVSKVEAIMNNQWPDEKRIEKSHFVINNDDSETLKNQVLAIHKELISNN